MIKYIMRKTIYKDFDYKTQNILLQLVFQQDIIEFLCSTLRLIIYFYIFMPFIIVNLCKNIQLTTVSKFIAVVLTVFYFVGILFLYKILTPDVTTFLHLISEKIYFVLYTAKGNALSKKDFEIVKNNDNTLYNFISSKKCQGYCYSVCFEILKILRKGSIEFVATKNVCPIEDYEEDDKYFTMHLLYVNNGWAFDTFCQRQFPIENLYKIYDAKLYKSFNFDEIKDLSFDDFRKKTSNELAKWCNNNDCSELWST